MRYSNFANEYQLSYQPMPFADGMESDRPFFNHKLDLNLYCIKRPQQTCFIRVTNSHLVAWGIEQGDMLVVEKKDSLSIGDLIVLKSEDKMEIYELVTHHNDQFIFFPLNPAQKTIKISDWTELNIVGTITSNIHQLKPKNSVRFAA